MANGQTLRLLFVFWVLQKGLTALIETQQTVMAAEGEEASLNCKLMQSKEVLQVTWQKILPEGEKNLATYGKNFGLRVNKGFQGKLKLKYGAVQNCSIVIRRVMDEDEGCYRCLFNTYPEGALIGTTCLRLYELHEPVLHVRDSPAETVVSCSATGRPAPTVTLTVPHYNSTSVPNTNGTVTVTTTAVLPRPRDNSTQVGCVVQVLSGPQMEASALIPACKELPDPDDDVTLITSISLVVACVCAAAAIIIFLLIRKRQNRLCHRETPQKTTKDTHEVRTPLMKIISEVRLRMSSEKKTQKPQSPQTETKDTHEVRTPLLTKLSEVWLQMSCGEKTPKPKSPQTETKDTHEVRTPSTKPVGSARQRMSSVKKENKECSDKKSLRRNLHFEFE